MELGRFAAARVGHNTACIEHHLQRLRERGETDRRLRELDHWPQSSAFTKREKATLALSEALSLNESSTETIEQARRYLNVSETVRLTLAVMAVNDWITVHSSPVRVLVVEDSPDDQELLRHQLEKTQMATHVAFVPDAAQALDLLIGSEGETFRQELVAIFLDLHLPGMSGIELLQRIRVMPGMADFPVIVMTSSNDPRDVEECRRLKVASYVPKPITYHSFSHAVANVFHRDTALKGGVSLSEREP